MARGPQVPGCAKTVQFILVAGNLLLYPQFPRLEDKLYGHSNYAWSIKFERGKNGGDESGERQGLIIRSFVGQVQKEHSVNWALHGVFL